MMPRKTILAGITLAMVPTLIFFCAPRDSRSALARHATGTIRHPVLAVGGETTGTELELADGTVFELDLSDHAELKKLAGSLGDKRATVRGIYREKKGLEVSVRKTIQVQELRAGTK